MSKKAAEYIGAIVVLIAVSAVWYAIGYHHGYETGGQYAVRIVKDECIKKMRDIGNAFGEKHESLPAANAAGPR